LVIIANTLFMLLLIIIIYLKGKRKFEVDSVKDSKDSKKSGTKLEPYVVY
jgi:hypothetical protein